MSAAEAKPRTFRHGLSCLWRSEIGDQFYCEYKFHPKRIHPEIQVESPAVELGEALASEVLRLSAERSGA